MWIFSGLSDSGLSDKLWDWGVLPYFEGGMGAIEGDFMLASGVGVNIFIFLRVDYRHFFVFDGDDIDRVYTGIEIPLLIPSD